MLVHKLAAQNKLIDGLRDYLRRQFQVFGHLPCDTLWPRLRRKPLFNPSDNVIAQCDIWRSWRLDGADRQPLIVSSNPNFSLAVRARCGNGGAGYSVQIGIHLIFATRAIESFRFNFPQLELEAI